MTVIEQFEKAPLDLGGKRASQLLRKKRRNRRRQQRQRPRHTSADSDGEEEDGGGIDDEEDEDGNARRRPSKTRTAARAREREVYKSAQFIEDSDEEYGRDIDGFFAREAELRERTALAAVDSALGTGTMRTSGTKKRRRPRGRPVDVDDGGGGSAREAKRIAVSQNPGSDDGTLSESESVPAAPREHRPPKARPRYRGSVTAATTTIEDELSTQQRDDPQEGVLTAFLAPDDEDVVSSHGVGDQDRNESDAGEDDENANHGVSSLAGSGAVVPNSSAPRKGRVIISDEEE